jgi:hypothetical protein
MDNGKWGKHGNDYEICKQVGKPRGPGWGKVVALGGERSWPRVGNPRGPDGGKVMALPWGKLLALGGECYWPVTRIQLRRSVLLLTFDDVPAIIEKTGNSEND